MAALIKVYEKNGVGETATDKTDSNILFKNADDAVVDFNDPLILPVTGQEYSFRKVLRMNIAGGTFTTVSNLRWYTDGANNFGTGVKLWLALTGTYTQPAVPSEANDPPQFPGVTPMVDAFGYTVGAPADLDAINTGPFDNTGLPKDIGDYLNLVMEVEPTAAPGSIPTEEGTFLYDEV